MAKIMWLPSFETGIPDIDNDHRELVEAIDKIQKALEADDSKACSVLFHDFLELAAAHFKREEAFLISIDYPRVESHSAAHKQLLEMGRETLETAKADPESADAKHCLEEMIYFLLEDIIKADSEFKTYAQDRARN